MNQVKIVQILGEIVKMHKLKKIFISSFVYIKWLTLEMLKTSLI